MVTKMNITGVVLVLVAVMVGKTAAVDHVVGDSTGWGIPTTDPSTYANWASQRTFTVGDTLVFNFATGSHDVAKVTKSAFDSCSANGPLALVTVGPANFTLNATGEEHFICTFGQHCSIGQKLAINVTAASTPTPAPSPATTPSPSPTPTGAPTPTPTRAPTPSTTPAPTPMATPTPSPSPSMGPSGPVPSPSGGGAGTPPSSSPPPGSATPGTTLSPETPPEAQTPPAPSSAPRNLFAPSLIMFMSIAITIMC